MLWKIMGVLAGLLVVFILLVRSLHQWALKNRVIPFGDMLRFVEFRGGFAEDLEPHPLDVINDAQDEYVYSRTRGRPGTVYFKFSELVIFLSRSHREVTGDFLTFQRRGWIPWRAYFKEGELDNIHLAWPWVEEISPQTLDEQTVDKLYVLYRRMKSFVPLESCTRQ